MNKKILMIATATLLLAGCGGKAEKEAAAKAEAAVIEQTEAISSQIDSTIQEIEASAMKLDTLLNDL